MHLRAQLGVSAYGSYMVVRCLLYSRPVSWGFCMAAWLFPGLTSTSPHELHAQVEPLCHVVNGTLTPGPGHVQVMKPPSF